MREIFLTRRGTLHLGGWHGNSAYDVLVIDRTPKRYRILAITDTPLPRRTLPAGEMALVPRSAITLGAVV